MVELADIPHPCELGAIAYVSHAAAYLLTLYKAQLISSIKVVLIL